jgi:hypothetical protein
MKSTAGVKYAGTTLKFIIIHILHEAEIKLINIIPNGSLYKTWYIPQNTDLIKIFNFYF